MDPLYSALQRLCLNSTRMRLPASHKITSTPLSFSSRFSTCPRIMGKPGLLDPARQKGRAPPDRRTKLLRYSLMHPLDLTPRPLKFSRNRSLRHWTIHRAWQLYQAKRRESRTLALERQYNCMKQACEELHSLGESEAPDANCVDESGEIVDMRRVYRRAMEKKGVWGEVPREYAGRLVTDWPSQKGWDSEWRR